MYWLGAYIGHFFFRPVPTRDTVIASENDPIKIKKDEGVGK